MRGRNHLAEAETAAFGQPPGPLRNPPNGRQGFVGMRVFRVGERCPHSLAAVGHAFPHWPLRHRHERHELAPFVAGRERAPVPV